MNIIAAAELLNDLMIEFRVNLLSQHKSSKVGAANKALLWWKLCQRRRLWEQPGVRLTTWCAGQTLSHIKHEIV